MSTLYVVRHGQASLFSEDYDRLSPLGVEQSKALARHWIDQHIRPDSVWTGTLRRQTATADAVAGVYAEADEVLPAPGRNGGFDEYPAEAILATVGEQLRLTRPEIAALAEAFEAAGEGKADSRSRYRRLHRYLEAVIAAWVRGNYDEEPGFPVTWDQWSQDVRDALAAAMAATGKGEACAIFTSGGVVGLSLQTVLQAPDIKAAEVNWRVYNASVTRYTFSGAARISLDRFNDVTHLPAEHLTYR